MSKKYDVICIGAGPGGYSAAIRLARAGKSVAVIDRSAASLGGTCLNEGCVPVKSMLKISKMRAELKKKGERYGLGVEVKRPDLKKITAYSREMSAALKKGIVYFFKKNKVDFIEGEASLVSANKVSVKHGTSGSGILEASDIILATGSRPAEVSGLEFDGVKIISSREAVSLEVLPKRMIIAGAGAIGIEFACIFNNLGSEIILVEVMDYILPTEDKDMALGLSQLLKKDGIKIYTKSRLEIKQKEEGPVRVKITGADKEEEVETDLVLVAAGRQPAINIEELKKVGIEIEGGRVRVDENMKTTVSHIYAVGDITPYPMFAHAAYRESEIAALSILGKPS
ncbi:MAG: NAD(P)/FAD-dependent oxidoreductase, partial [Candidatus Omnitrophica bacterium]|nr:NAD(P)/FAD-dependent oxidoreductase [Candidatus Omnitrophota bacterium]